ncbi:MAG: hypothetical protein WKF87_03775 [Chryseolinea sp.]
MRINFFWNTWLSEYRRLWYTSAAIALFLLVFMWYWRFAGAEGVIDWIKLQEQKVIETSVHTFQLGPFNLSIPADSYVILEYFHGSDITPNTGASNVFVLGLVFGIALLLTAVTTMQRYWYFAGMALYTILIVSLRMEVLGLFGVYTRLPAGIAIALFIAVSFYFNRIRPDVSVYVRLLIFLIMSGGLGLIIGFFSSVDYPFFHLSLTGYAAGMVISILFIILVAHEIIAGFIFVVGQSKTHSLRHFFIIVTIYLANIIIACLYELGSIQWKFLYVDLYLLLTCSAVLGVWGMRQREDKYAHIFSAAPMGVVAFLGMAAICFATIGQLLGNANDPALKVIRDGIIFSHTGYGIIFLVYIFSNFILLLARNLPVYKVLYNPTRMPYFTFRFAGMIAMLGFVFYSNWRDYIYHGLSGFYNTTGDLYALLGNDLYAESFYEQGAQQGFLNNRSNYALATMKAARMDFEPSHQRYEYANDLRPTLFSLTNAGNLFVWENQLPGAIEAYRRGYSRMPGAVLQNNLGFAFTKSHALDSALVFLNAAREDKQTRTTAEINFFALAALESVPLKTDSILDLFDASATPVLANALALSTMQHQEFKKTVDPLANKKLDLYSATLLNNYAVKYATTLDTAFLSNAYSIASDSLNGDFSEVLKSSIAFGYYHRGNISRALQILAELVYVTQDYKGKYNYIMGLWALEQGNPELASSYFTFADTYDYKEARFYNAIALSEAGRIEEAAQAWDSVAVHQQGELQIIALQMKKILSMPVSAAASLNDGEKYQFCRYRISLRDSSTLNLLLNNFSDANYKAQTILDASKRYYDAGLTFPAIRYFNRIAGLQLTDKGLYEEIRHFELLMLASRRDLPALTRQINNGVTFDTNRSLYKELYTALIAEASNDTTLARKHFEILATYNPYLEEAIIASADFFRTHDKNRLRAYSILAEAIQINSNSIKLLKAYVAEATRVGFDQYAYDAGQRQAILESGLY